MMPSSTLSYADLYGAKTPEGSPTNPSVTEKSSGTKNVSQSEQAPSYAWVGIVGMLLLIRILYERLPAGGL